MRFGRGMAGVAVIGTTRRSLAARFLRVRRVRNGKKSEGEKSKDAGKLNHWRFPVKIRPMRLRQVSCWMAETICLSGPSNAG
jgi:hypothetical protein